MPSFWAEADSVWTFNIWFPNRPTWGGDTICSVRLAKQRSRAITN